MQPAAQPDPTPTAPRIAFRVDATPALGHGHLKRCLALALALRAQGAVVAFAGRYAAGTAAGILGAEGIPWCAVPMGDAGPQADAALCVTNLPWTPDAVVWTTTHWTAAGTPKCAPPPVRASWSSTTWPTARWRPIC
jgi:hypothetical protein